MSMEVKNNISALKTVNRLNKNSGKLAKSLKKVSSGMRIVGAADDTSGYSISERMRVMIRGLEQDVRNVQNGRSLLKVAAGGIDNIVEELRNLKELALNAANDHNTDADRATIQKEFEHKMVNINDIASETNYNGKILLDGRYGLTLKKTIEEIPDMAPIGNVTGGSPFYISTDGAYTIDSGFSGDIIIQANNVELIGSGSRLTDVSIYGNSAGNLNLTIKNLDIYEANPRYRSAIQFYGNNNTLSLKGTNTIETASVPRSIADRPGINIGGELTIKAGDETGTLNMIDHRSANDGCIGTSYNDSTSGASSNLTIDSGTINITTGGSGAAIGSGSCAAIGDITINNADITITTASVDAAAIGSGWVDASAGDILINSGANITINLVPSSSSAAAIGAGWASSVGNITLKEGSNVNITGGWHNTVGAGKDGTGTGTVVNNSTSSGSENTKIFDGTPLVFHSGTKANVAMNVYINDMHTKKMGLDGVNVLTRHAATSALDSVDSAIEYALDQATTIGSIVSRLEYTETNLTTASENTQASESTFRDADMAKEMVEYTKNNVLLQAAQSMLAQANQSSSSVLGLLQ